MSKMIPTIPSNLAGPLGLVHLPRLWLKALLAGSGQLADGYKDIGPGYDFMVLEAIGISPDAARTYIHSAKPSYFAFEKWISAQPGAKLDKATIDASNAAVVGYHHDDEDRIGILAAAGLPDDGRFQDAVTLNSFDDWTEAHAAVVKGS
jgi:hypothetical protein